MGSVENWHDKKTLASSRSTSFLAALRALAFLEARLELEHCSARQRRRKQKRNRNLPRLRRGKTTHCQRSRAFSSVSLGAPLHHQHLSSRTHLVRHLRSRHHHHLVMHHQHLRLMHHRLNRHLHNWKNCLKKSLTALMLVRSRRRLLIHHASVSSFSLIHHLRWALSATVIQKILRLLGRVI